MNNIQHLSLVLTTNELIVYNCFNTTVLICLFFYLEVRYLKLFTVIHGLRCLSTWHINITKHVKTVANVRAITETWFFINRLWDVLGYISYKPLFPNDSMVINVFFVCRTWSFPNIKLCINNNYKKNNIDSNEALLSYTTVVVITTWIGNK